MSLRCLVKVVKRGLLRRFKNPKDWEETSSARARSDIDAQMSRSQCVGLRAGADCPTRDLGSLTKISVDSLYLSNFRRWDLFSDQISRTEIRPKSRLSISNCMDKM